MSKDIIVCSCGFPNLEACLNVCKYENHDIGCHRHENIVGKVEIKMISMFRELVEEKEKDKIYYASSFVKKLKDEILRWEKMYNHKGEKVL